ncbi:MAG: hypothetical protein QOF12_2727 [Solirubrobacteraceae bacterium]|nr:hypothetical protein [Solirubrobacteraceae bacterium]
MMCLTVSGSARQAAAKPAICCSRALEPGAATNGSWSSETTTVWTSGWSSANVTTSRLNVRHWLGLGAGSS